MRRLLTALTIAGAALVAPAVAGAEPVPFPYCAYDPTGNAGQWSDPCQPVGPQPDGRYNPPAMQWAPATDPSTGLTQNPYVAGGGQW